MLKTEKLAIPPLANPVSGEVNIPGSKSITNRALLLAALASGESSITHALFSDDTHYFSECLQKLSIPLISKPDSQEFIVKGKGGKIPAARANLFVGNAGTAARFITALVALGKGEYFLDGVPRMRERPIGELLTALEENGAKIEFSQNTGAMPFSLKANGFEGGSIRLRGDKTSQGISALLMIAPYALRDVSLEITGDMVSLPYLELTCRMMRQWGVEVENPEPALFKIKAGQLYKPLNYLVEPDASGASYFFAAAAVTKSFVKVNKLTLQSLQGDTRFVNVLEQMGCRVTWGPDYLALQGNEKLKGLEIDLNGMSDLVPTLAAIAPFASSPVTIRNVEHIRWKETDRITAVVTELRRLGTRVEEYPDGLKIYPGPLKPAEIETYDDHRMAMAFAITGLVSPGVVIKNPGCTAKTFPDFFDRLFALFT